MNVRFLVLTISALLAMLSAIAAQEADYKLAGYVRRTSVLDPQTLESIRQSISSGSPGYSSALDQLVVQAETALTQPPVSVMEKEDLPPSGDRHDYMSIALYAWPNPDTADGLPYIRRDGEVSPKAYSIPDKQNKGTMLSTVETLSLAWYFTGNRDYARHAAKMLRAWFIDPNTRMNPNLNYAQSWPGVNAGREYGIIDFAGFSELPDWLGLLEFSPDWTDADQAALRRWLADYLDWLRTSKFGTAISRSANNHGSWYDTQVAAIALYLGEDELARQVLEEAKAKRIAAHIEPDGRQPQELARTKSWDYSLYNLRALLRLAQLGKAAGVDLWGYAPDEGGGIPQALDYLLAYASHLDDWPDKQIYEIKPGSLAEPLAIAYQLSGDRKYTDALDRLGIMPGEDARLRLLYEFPEN